MEGEAGQRGFLFTVVVVVLLLEFCFIIIKGIDEIRTLMKGRK